MPPRRLLALTAALGAAGAVLVATVALTDGGGVGQPDVTPGDLSSIEPPIESSTSPDAAGPTGATVREEPFPGAYEDPVHDEAIAIEPGPDGVTVTITNVGTAVTTRVPLSVVLFDATGSRPSGSIDPSSVDHPTGCVAYRGAESGVYCPGDTLVLAPGETLRVRVPYELSGSGVVRAVLDWGLEASNEPLSARFDANPENDIAETVLDP